jgi:hypothetical protein
MANPIYARLQATAQRLIAKYGQSATVKRITPPDPVYGGEPVVTSYPATLVPMAYEARYIDGTVIQTGDMQIYISAVGLSIEPTVGDVVTANGADHQRRPEQIRWHHAGRLHRPRKDCGLVLLNRDPVLANLDLDALCRLLLVDVDAQSDSNDGKHGDDEIEGVSVHAAESLHEFRSVAQCIRAKACGGLSGGDRSLAIALRISRYRPDTAQGEGCPMSIIVSRS